MSGIPIITIPSDANIVLSSTSKGDSMKWFLRDSNTYIKANRVANGTEYQDAIAEVIASRVASTLNIPCVQYALCYIKEDAASAPILGTQSANFCEDTEDYISFETMVESSYDKVDWGMSARDNYMKTLSIFKTLCGLDATQYLNTMLLLDFLICNEDRHTNNFGVLYNAERETYRFPPQFDNGYCLGFMQHERKPVQQFLYSCKAKPFSTSFAKQLKLVDTLPNGVVLPISFDDGLFRDLPLTETRQTYCLDILHHQLNLLKEKFQ